MPASGKRGRHLLTQLRTAGIRLPDRQVRRLLTRIAVVAAACYGAWLAVAYFGRPYGFFDMNVYHGAVVWWTHGGDLYEFVAPKTTLGFTYPPFAALTMLPMAVFDIVTAGWINVLLGLLALGTALTVILVPIADRLGWSRWFTVALALPVFAAIEPVRESLGFGQINLLLFAMIIADLYALRRGSRWAGVGIGIAAAIKLTPALFIVYLLFSRQWRTAATAVGAASAVTVGAHLITPDESAAYWGSILWQTDRVGAADMTPNQSLAGVLARLYDSTNGPGLLWVSFTLVVLAVGLSRAVAAHDDGDELTAFTLVGLTANVISPISWTHHLVYVVPAAIVLVDQAIRRRIASRRPIRGNGSGDTTALPALLGLREPIWFPLLTGARHFSGGVAIYLLFLISPIWPYEHQLPAVSHYADGLYGLAAENSLATALIVLVAALPWRPGAEPVFNGSTAARRQGQLTHSSVPSAKI